MPSAKKSQRRYGMIDHDCRRNSRQFKRRRSRAEGEELAAARVAEYKKKGWI